jgi:hypothetical protein
MLIIPVVFTDTTWLEAARPPTASSDQKMRGLLRARHQDAETPFLRTPHFLVTFSRANQAERGYGPHAYDRVFSLRVGLLPHEKGCAW